MHPDEFFADEPQAHSLFHQIDHMVSTCGAASIRITKSQIAFRRKRAFAWVWLPGRALRRPAAPLVLSVALPWHDPSPRWKEVVEPAPGHWMHHLELHEPAELDDEVGGWLRQAWEAAG